MTDEAHDLITPLSWNEDTHFGGPSMVSQADASIVTVAYYAHSLIHRREGFAQGEYAMIGYQSAQYLANAADARSTSLPGDSSMLPFEQVRDIK